MTIDKILVTIIGIIVSLATYKFFLGKQTTEISSTSDSTIMVDGGYKPNVIRVPRSRSVILKFFRKDPSSCLEEVVLPEFGKRAFLPLNKETSLEIETKEPGVYELSCGMNMFHAKIIVE